MTCMLKNSMRQELEEFDLLPMNRADYRHSLTYSFYVYHQLVGGMATLNFGAYWIKTVVVMAAKSSYWLKMRKTVSPPFPSHFYWIFVKPADMQNKHKISDEFEFQLDRTVHFGVTHPWAPKKISHRLIMRKWCLQASTFIIDWIFVKLVGTQPGQA